MKEEKRKSCERNIEVSKSLVLSSSEASVAVSIAVVLLMQGGPVGRLDVVDVIEIHAGGLSGGRTIPCKLVRAGGIYI